MKQCIIYKLVCTVNGKPYIGFTRQTLENRWHGHLSESRKGISNRILSNAIRKYGSKAFSKEILYCSTDEHHTLNVMEGHFIRQYNSHFKDGYGYNMTYGGEGKNSGLKHTKRSPEHCEAIRQAHLGKKLTEAHKTKIAAAGRNRKHTQETIIKMKQVTRSEEFKQARRAFRPTAEQIAQRVARRTSRTWTLQKPDGTQIHTQHLKQTCRENGVKYIALWAAHKQNRGINRGLTKG
jgi:group I intron endonuclease